MAADILKRKNKSFILWLPAKTTPPPQVVIAEFQAGNPATAANVRKAPLTEIEPGLWEVAAAGCGLTDGTVYHYWFEVADSAPWGADRAIWCTDPLAWTVDWRLTAPSQYSRGDGSDAPAGMVLYQAGRLLPCDAGGETASLQAEPPPENLDLVPNHQLVIYEIPTRWAQSDPSRLMGAGTFRDLLALVDPAARPVNFAGCGLLEAGRAYILDLGVNAVELLPPADSWPDRLWGYGTCNFLAPDFELGFPLYYSWPTAMSDLSAFVRACHHRGIRFFIDVVLGYGCNDPYVTVNYDDFHVPPAGDFGTAQDDDQKSSRAGQVRQSWGGELFRYARTKPMVYDPLDGAIRDLVPARQFMKTAIERWMMDFHADGIRMDSLETIANWDFIGEFTQHARDIWRKRWGANPGADERFLVVGEELELPMALLDSQRRQVDALWNEPFRHRIRSAILGNTYWADTSFEQMIRKLIDCRATGFASGNQAVNYLTSHDVEGAANQRLYDFLQDNSVFRKEERTKLAFTCLLTAAGIPMILAGEEFGDHQDVARTYPVKQMDTVNWDRLQQAIDQEAAATPPRPDQDVRWRARLFRHVQRLILLRTTHPGLRGDDVHFLHFDFYGGKRVAVWQRGGGDVIVVANFSDWGTTNPDDPNAEYVVPTWPATPGRSWREVTQDYPVPAGRAGKEPLRPWEAKVYRLV